MPQNHNIIIAGGNAGTEQPAAVLFKIPLFCHKDIGVRIQRQQFGPDLFGQVVGHDDHGLVAQAQAFLFHGCRAHDDGLARAHRMGYQRIASEQDAGHRVALMGPQRDLRVHTGESQETAVIFTWA